MQAGPAPSLPFTVPTGPNVYTADKVLSIRINNKLQSTIRQKIKMNHV